MLLAVTTKICPKGRCNGSLGEGKGDASTEANDLYHAVFTMCLLMAILKVLLLQTHLWLDIMRHTQVIVMLLAYVCGTQSIVHQKMVMSRPWVKIWHQSQVYPAMASRKQTSISHFTSIELASLTGLQPQSQLMVNAHSMQHQEFLLTNATDQYSRQVVLS